MRSFSINTKRKALKPKFQGFWSCWADSNCRPHPYQGCALPTELQQQRCSPSGELSITANADIYYVATRKGLEPSTSGVTGRRSNQLNYRATYIERLTRLIVKWQGQKESNPRHAVLETAALPAELYPCMAVSQKWWAFTGSNRGPAGYEPAALTN